MTENNIKSSFKELVGKGTQLFNQKNYIEAIKIFKLAAFMCKNITAQESMYIDIMIANCYYDMDNKEKYIYYYEKYLEKDPKGQESVFTRLAHAYYFEDVDKCIDYHNKALNFNVNAWDVVYKIFSLTKSPYYSQENIKEEAEYEIFSVKNYLYKNIKQFNHDSKKQNPARKFNIGYLTGDLYTHTMMNYMIPIFENHNKNDFNFTIFSTTDRTDYKTQYIKNLGYNVINCASMEIDKLAEEIYKNNIDILVDLSGFTSIKAFVLLYKPAPIIVSYLGYINTMGMKEVDYILTDKYTLPESTQYMYTEKPLYLDYGYWRFKINQKELPNLTECPFKTQNYITFGSFNCTSKINETLIYMWAKILRAVPDSKLLIYRSQITKNIIKRYLKIFEEFNIKDDRLIISNKIYNPHYYAYFEADISLDTYPFSGMSIATEAALMGVPTVTLTGDESVGMQSKGAARVNNVLGLDDLVASCGDDYIQKAVNLANDKEKLSYLRWNLRQKVLDSALIQGAKEFTENLEEKYRKIMQDFINSP